MKQAHRHIDTRWEFGRDGCLAYCRECKQWRTVFETGFDPPSGHLLGPWPNPPKGSLLYEMERLRGSLRRLGWAILYTARIPDLVEWLDMKILRWRLKRNIRRHHRRLKNLRVGQVEGFLEEIGLTEEQFKSIRKDIR